jgi:hypothetical protein
VDLTLGISPSGKYMAIAMQKRGFIYDWKNQKELSQFKILSLVSFFAIFLCTLNDHDSTAD